MSEEDYPEDYPLRSARSTFNREQHKYIDNMTTSHNCKTCGLRYTNPAHARYERAAAPYRAFNQGRQAGGEFSYRMPKSPRMSEPVAPTTGDKGKDHRFRKWQSRLAGAKLGSDKEAMIYAMLETFAKDSPSCKQWLKAEKIRRLDALKLKQAKDRQEDLEIAERAQSIGSGKLYFAPLGTEPKFGPEWVHIGYTSEGMSESVVTELKEPINFAGAFKSHTTQHIHFDIAGMDTTNLKKVFGADLGLDRKSTEISGATQEVEAMMNINQNPDDMDKAALRLATLAQEIRTHDEREPQGDEPVITWKRTFIDGGTEYTYVAVKLGERWFVTGNQHVGMSYVWRDFLDKDFAKPVAAGEFLVCSEWTPAA